MPLYLFHGRSCALSGYYFFVYNSVRNLVKAGILMFQVNDDTLVVAVSELRTKGPEVLDRVKNGTVIVTRNNQPVGVIIDHDKYREMGKAFELLEDLVLGTIAQKREKEAKGKKLISHDNMPW